MILKLFNSLLTNLYELRVVGRIYLIVGNELIRPISSFDVTISMCIAAKDSDYHECYNCSLLHNRPRTPLPGST